MQVTAIILAGGKSSRMGRDKGLAEYGGMPLVQYSINACEIITNDILISTRNQDYARFGFPLVADNFTERGPVGGLEAALSVSRSDLNIVCPCDMPGIHADILNMLLMNSQWAKAVVAQDSEGKVYPVLGVYNRSAIPVIRELIRLGEYRMTRLLQSLDAKTVVVEPAGQLVNINFPEDLQ
jgi:molybdopterin-guanine dinucleotide biosynthesis protein A